MHDVRRVGEVEAVFSIRRYLHHHYHEMQIAGEEGNTAGLLPASLVGAPNRSNG